jgi:hypothetical protein
MSQNETICFIFNDDNYDNGYGDDCYEDDDVDDDDCDDDDYNNDDDNDKEMMIMILAIIWL